MHWQKDALTLRTPFPEGPVQCPCSGASNTTVNSHCVAPLFDIPSQAEWTNARTKAYATRNSNLVTQLCRPALSRHPRLLTITRAVNINNQVSVPPLNRRPPLVIRVPAINLNNQMWRSPLSRRPSLFTRVRDIDLNKQICTPLLPAYV
jgi:hypothetical protein